MILKKLSLPIILLICLTIFPSSKAFSLSSASISSSFDWANLVFEIDEGADENETIIDVTSDIMWSGNQYSLWGAEASNESETIDYNSDGTRTVDINGPWVSRSVVASVDGATGGSYTQIDNDNNFLMNSVSAEANGYDHTLASATADIHRAGSFSLAAPEGITNLSYYLILPFETILNVNDSDSWTSVLEVTLTRDGDVIDHDIYDYRMDISYLLLDVMEYGVTYGLDAHIYNSISVSEDDISPPVAPVPEPTTILLLGSGLFGLGWYGRKRKKS